MDRGLAVHGLLLEPIAADREERKNEGEGRMMKYIQLPIVFRIAGLLMGGISIFGGIAAWGYGHSGEPYRYLVAAFIMFGSGILWLVCSIIPRFLLSRKQYLTLFSVFLPGIALGLVDTFIVCGGECGLGAGFCHLYLGYPGRWLRISNCMAGSTGTIWWWIMKGGWHIDFPSFVADIVFWCGVGLIVSLIWKAIRMKTSEAANEK